MSKRVSDEQLRQILRMSPSKTSAEGRLSVWKLADDLAAARVDLAKAQRVIRAAQAVSRSDPPIPDDPEDDNVLPVAYEDMMALDAALDAIGALLTPVEEAQPPEPPETTAAADSWPAPPDPAVET